ncbi:urease accessory protein UreF [Aestuariivirga sp. YIM B02566]|uniref:Urease accessory protein UreF n=1 Tax=Taklimakanibacter albus TaxID=2800327 RepID=A0ACC5RBW4_9HYPH|nr:urease accessory protein UreF [Aestuariivirga sp. YIM B02566]MBK1870114.1 urease accessory protein UreF [Aestuariivirga sp. YIM B02566]
MSTDALSLLRLMTWLSPAFPVGAFSYSHGLEQAVHDRIVVTRHDLAEWITDLIRQGSWWNDVVLLTEAWHAAALGDMGRLGDVAELGEAMAVSAERHLETMDQGRSFSKAARAWRDVPGDDLEMPYPVAVGAVAARMDVGIDGASTGYLQACAGNLISAGLRLIPLGQTEGTLIMAALEKIIVTVAGKAARSSLSDLGSSTFAVDIASMRHETMNVRLFRS